MGKKFEDFSERQLRLAEKVIYNYDQTIMDLENGVISVREAVKRFKDYGEYSCLFCRGTVTEDLGGHHKDCRKCVLHQRNTSMGCLDDPKSGEYRGVRKSYMDMSKLCGYRGHVKFSLKEAIDIMKTRRRVLLDLMEANGIVFEEVEE